MKKSEKSFWECSECGHVAVKWSGQCPGCAAWNTLQEKKSIESFANKIAIKGFAQETTKFSDAVGIKKNRISSGLPECDRVLGGGFLSDSITLLVGNPGIGKSTLALQTAGNIAKQGGKVLVASGEESVSQIVDRANRTMDKIDNLEILNELLVENLIATAEKIKPDFIVTDSIQTFISGDINSVAGSIPQIRTVTEKLMHFAKTRNIPCLLIGHVTKDGEMAGPQLLAHLVDTVLVIEGDQHHEFRLLRSTKNRFGSVFEVGVFEMCEMGLVEVKNPSAAFLSGRLSNAIGSIVFPTVEGTRPFLVEIQGLASITKFGYPKRTASGIALSRLSLILAVLQNHAKVNFDNRDVFTNIVGGFKISEPAADLPLALALVSAQRKKAIAEEIFACGEIGLSGEIRAVSHIEKRLQEAKKLGFKKAIIPKTKNIPQIKDIEIVSVKTISEAIQVASL